MLPQRDMTEPRAPAAVLNDTRQEDYPLSPAPRILLKKKKTRRHDKARPPQAPPSAPSVSASINNESYVEQTAGALYSAANEHIRWQQEVHELFGNEISRAEIFDARPGTRDGQVMFAQEANGNIVAYQWFMGSYEWTILGIYEKSTSSITGNLSCDSNKSSSARQDYQKNTPAHFRALAKKREAMVAGTLVTQSGAARTASRANTSLDKTPIPVLHTGNKRRLEPPIPKIQTTTQTRLRPESQPFIQLPIPVPAPTSVLPLPHLSPVNDSNNPPVIQHSHLNYQTSTPFVPQSLYPHSVHNTSQGLWPHAHSPWLPTHNQWTTPPSQAPQRQPATITRQRARYLPNLQTWNLGFSPTFMSDQITPMANKFHQRSLVLPPSRYGPADTQGYAMHQSLLRMPEQAAGRNKTQLDPIGTAPRQTTSPQMIMQHATPLPAKLGHGPSLEEQLRAKLESSQNRMSSVGMPELGQSSAIKAGPQIGVPEPEHKATPAETYTFPSTSKIPPPTPQNFNGPFFCGIPEEKGKGSADATPARSHEEEVDDWFYSRERFARHEDMYRKIQDLSKHNSASHMARTDSTAVSTEASTEETEEEKPFCMIRLFIPILENLLHYTEGGERSERMGFLGWRRS